MPFKNAFITSTLNRFVGGKCSLSHALLLVLSQNMLPLRALNQDDCQKGGIFFQNCDLLISSKKGLVTMSKIILTFLMDEQRDPRIVISDNQIFVQADIVNWLP